MPSGRRSSPQDRVGHHSLDIQKDNDTGDVVDHVLFLLPPLERRANQRLGCTLRILLRKERVDNIRDDLVVEELPNTITCEHNYLIVWGHVENLDLWDRIYSNSSRG